LTVYTCIFGNYDDLKEPLVITEGWDYVCFTNQPLKSNTWKIIQVKTENERTEAKRVKILPHLYLEDSKTVYVDGSFFINCDLNEWYSRHKEGISFIKHNTRSCVYKEAIAARHKSDPVQVREQLNRFRELGIKDNSGMVASGIIIRDGSNKDFLEMWFEEYLRGCVRDQIAWAYANYHYPNVSKVIDYDYAKGPEFVYIPHHNNMPKRLARIQRLKKEYALPY
jgi:hypothetical protein